MSTEFLTQVWQMFLATCGAFITIAGAAAIVFKIYKALKQPDSERDMRISQLEKENQIAKQRMDDFEAGMVHIMKSNIAIMRHLVDGGHKEELEQSLDELQDYLIKRSTTILKDDKK